MARHRPASGAEVTLALGSLAALGASMVAISHGVGRVASVLVFVAAYITLAAVIARGLLR